MLRRLASAALVVTTLAMPLPALAQTAPATTQPAAPAAAPQQPPPVLPFDEALAAAAARLLASAKLPDSPDKLDLVIDPLIDSLTGGQTSATRAMGRKLTQIIEKKQPRLDVKPFNAAEVSKSPLVLIGTFTLLNNAGQAGAPKDAYRIWLTLADLKTGKIIGKGQARAKPDGVANVPAGYFAETPVFAKDPVTEGYIKTCEGTPLGGEIDKRWADAIRSAALVSDAINAYDAGKYQAAYDLYSQALGAPGGDQLRVHNGLYLSSWKLGRKDQATQAFGKVVDYGFANNKLGMRLLFKPGTNQFVADKRLSGPYSMWLSQIANRAETKGACLEIIGHTSPTGPEPLNQRLSLLRAEHVKKQLASLAKPLANRMIAAGVGSAETIVGSGKDNASDALDRRVEFKVVKC